MSGVLLSSETFRLQPCLESVSKWVKLSAACPFERNPETEDVEDILHSWDISAITKPRCLNQAGDHVVTVAVAGS